MRKELKNIIENDYWIYGLTEEDFNFILRLTKEYIACRKEELDRRIEQAIVDNPEPGIHCEIISDLAHYTWVDSQYLWQFCLCRFQGIFEALIANTFLPKKIDKKMIGLKSKLDALKKVGYSLSDEECNELSAWADLRNALSHAPPEQYSPGPLREEDVLEYKEFLEKICKRWRIEEKDIKMKK